MTWKTVATPADAKALLDLFGGFHDACIREIHLWTDHCVGKDLAMSCSGDTRIRMLVQRQFKNPSAIEMYFDKVTRFNCVPNEENYDWIIFDAALLIHNGVVYWADNNNFSPDKPHNDIYTWISAKKLHWRDASDWLGEDLHYGPIDGDNPNDENDSR